MRAWNAPNAERDLVFVLLGFARLDIQLGGYTRKCKSQSSVQTFQIPRPNRTSGQCCELEVELRLLQVKFFSSEQITNLEPTFSISSVLFFILRHSPDIRAYQYSSKE